MPSSPPVPCTRSVSASTRSSGRAPVDLDPVVSPVLRSEAAVLCEAPLALRSEAAAPCEEFFSPPPRATGASSVLRPVAASFFEAPGTEPALRSEAAGLCGVALERPPRATSAVSDWLSPSPEYVYEYSSVTTAAARFAPRAFESIVATSASAHANTSNKLQQTSNSEPRPQGGAPRAAMRNCSTAPQEPA